MTTLKNHPGYWLRDDAARAFDDAEAAYGIFAVSSAGRTVADQQGLINRWNQGGPLNRPPYLYEPAQPPSSSNHVIDGGIAVDTPDWVRFATICTRYGFKHTYPAGDPVHFDFVGGYTPAGGNATPIPGTVSPEEDEEDMAQAVGHYIGGSAATPPLERTSVIFYPNSGWYTLFTGVQQDYINAQAQAHKTGNFVPVTENQWLQTIKPNLEKLLAK